jgi:Na+-transporting NADH:ubiquinone oxidoreductase subunit F
MPDFKKATLISHESPASKFHDLVFETPEPFNFKPGQFISIKINDQKMNAYSIAGRLEPNKFGLIIDSTPGGLGSQYIEQLKPGDQIDYLGPFGNFVLNFEDGAEHLVLLGTGCGIAPLKAMVESALREHKTDKKISLYFGLRFCSDVFWDKYFNQLAQEYPNFEFKLVLSKPDDAWCGSAGHVTDLMKNEIKDGSKCAGYICGNKKMAEESIKILQEIGCPPERIYHEEFG